MSESKKNQLNISAAEELKVLRRIVEIISSELDLNHILEDVVQIVNEVTKGDSIFIYMFDEAKSNLVLMASKTPHKQELGTIVLKTGEGITGWVAEKNETVAILKDASQDSRFKNFDVLPEDKYEAFLSVPVVYKNKPIGVVNVQHVDQQNYSNDLINLIALIAKQIGGLLENAKLYEDSKKKALQFDSLNKVSQSIISEDYLDEILNLTVVVTAKMLNSKICSIMLLDAKGKKLKMHATQSLSQDYKKKADLDVNNSIMGDVIKSKSAVEIYDVCNSEKYQYQDLAKQEQLTSMLSVPMIVKDRAIGVISVYTKEPHHFTEDEAHVLQIVANQAAVAVENTKLVEDTVKAKEALETRKLVERAKGILMRMNSIDEDAAYRLIHKKSMDSCKTMKQISESIILMDEFSS